MTKSKPIAERFWTRVDKCGPSECWEWTGAKNKGYGQIGSGGRGGLVLRSHRVSMDLHGFKIPSGLLVLHKCDNPPCVNPAHLYIGTQADNMRDMAERRIQKTHCKRGHPFEGYNLKIPTSGGRTCRACCNETHRKYMKKRRAESLEFRERCNEKSRRSRAKMKAAVR